MIGLEERTEMMTRNVIMAAIHHDLWSLHIHETTWNATEHYREIMMDLWAANSLAHRYSFYVRTAAAYAQGPKVNGIPRLMRDCSGKLTKEGATRLAALFAEAKPLADKIAGLRNTVYAHQSARMRVQEAYAEAKISLDMAQRLMVISIDIVNELRAAVGLGAIEISRSHIDQFERTMKGHWTALITDGFTPISDISGRVALKPSGQSSAAPNLTPNLDLTGCRRR